MPRVVILLLCLIAAVPPAVGQTSENEAARLYREAQELQRRFFEQYVGDDYDSPYWNLEWVPERVDPLVAQRYINGLQPAIRALRAAWEAGPPDFALEYERGLDMPQPHLQTMRSMYRIMGPDLIYRMYTGDTGRVAGDLTNLYDMGHYLRGDGTVIGGLVEVALFHATSRVVTDHAIAGGHLSAAEARSLLETIDSVVGNDPFGMAAAYQSERERLVPWLREMNETDDSRAELIDELSLWKTRAGDLDHADLLESLTPGGIEQAIVQHDIALARVAGIHAIDDLGVARDEYDAFLRDLRAGVYGPIAPVLIPTEYNLIDTIILSLEMTADVRKELSAIAASPGGAADMRNAALWYRRAMAMQERLFSAEEIDAIRAAAALNEPEDGANPAETSAADVDPLLARAEPIFEVLLEAAEITRCVWHQDRRRFGFRSGGRPDYLEPTRDLMALHLAAARSALASADARRAVSHLAATLIMLEHLRQDRLFETSRFARGLFARARLTFELLAAANPSRDDLVELEVALSRMDLHDPFGFRVAVSVWPEYFTGELLKQYAKFGRKDTVLDTVRWMPRRIEMIDADATVLVGELALFQSHELPGLLRAFHELARKTASEALGCETLDAVDALELTVHEWCADARFVEAPSWPGFLTDPLLAAIRDAIAARSEFQSAIEPFRAATAAASGANDSSD